MTPDVNVLIAASRSDHPHHPIALPWLNDALAACGQGQTLNLWPMVLTGFLRLVTHPKVFPDPTPVEQALAFVDAVKARPGVRVPKLGAELPTLHALCLQHQLTGNRIPDAWIAACVLASGDHLSTFDRDFKTLLPARSVTILKAG